MLCSQITFVQFLTKLDFLEGQTSVCAAIPGKPCHHHHTPRLQASLPAGQLTLPECSMQLPCVAAQPISPASPAVQACLNSSPSLAGGPTPSASFTPKMACEWSCRTFHGEQGPSTGCPQLPPSVVPVASPTRPPAPRPAATDLRRYPAGCAGDSDYAPASYAHIPPGGPQLPEECVLPEAGQE